MIKSVLIANRGEIACRIIRTARCLGIQTVAIYSQVDAASLAVQMADKAYAIGPPAASESYLNITKIIAIAKTAKVDAIHPGYGFLAENVTFAKACREAGFIFIGPSLEALQKMGSKSEAKAIARKSGIPSIPGYEKDQNNLSEEADRIGYPLMIKAVLGGGGKGLRRVNAQAEFQDALETCQREALSFFGSADVLLEKYIPSARHIEVQIFGDTHGNIVHLFERDCSLQRHHQKVVEETPSLLSIDLKEDLCHAACKLGHFIRYEGAGTVEFLVDEEGKFYFMEMNTRLQVEHPITEVITNLDLVEWQFQVASGQKLPLFQEEIHQQGHALELRLYAEDPHCHFKPVTGRIWSYQTPENVRIDSGIHPIDTITPYYDSLLAKLIVKGENRLEALQKAHFALNTWKILGLKTNLLFLKNLLEEKSILNNHFDREYIDHHLEKLAPQKDIPARLFDAASLIKVLSELKDDPSPWAERRNWRLEGYAPLSLTWVCEEIQKTVFLTYSPKGWMDESLELFEGSLSDQTLSFPDLILPYWKRGEVISLFYQGENYNFTPHSSLFIKPPLSNQASSLKAPLTGRVALILVTTDEIVSEHQPLLILEAMKMEHMIISPQKGKIKNIFYKIGDVVEEGADVIDIEQEGEDDELAKTC